MSKKTCHECENSMYQMMCSNTLCPIENERFAEQCGGFTQIQKLPKILFDRITTSPEVLAPHFVFLKGVFVTNINPQQQWISTLTGEVYPTRAEAISATVAKLKEVCDDTK